MVLRFDELARSESDSDLVKEPIRASVIARKPPKSAIPKRNTAIPVDLEAFAAAGNKQYEHTDEAIEKTFAAYGFTKGMTAKAKHALTNEIVNVFSLLDNSSAMTAYDGCKVVGKSTLGATVSGLDLQELLVKTEEGGTLSGDNARERREAAGLEVQMKTETCTRWEELAEETKFQIEVAAMTKRPTEFQLISIPSKGVTRKFGLATDEGEDEFSMETEPAEGDVAISKRGRKSMTTGRNTVMGNAVVLSLDEEASLARDAIEDLTGALKGLPRSIAGLLKEIRNALEDNKEILVANERRAVVTVITGSMPWGSRAVSADGTSAQDEFLDLVKTFADLPVTFVFFVKNTDEAVLEFYEMLLDFARKERVDVRVSKSLKDMSEGIGEHNSWLNYCSAVHLNQLLGVARQGLLFDASCRELTLEEAGLVCRGLLGDDMPDPTSGGLDGFVAAVKEAVDVEAVQWNPAGRKWLPLIDVDELKDAYSGEKPKGGAKKKSAAKAEAPAASKLSTSTARGGGQEKQGFFGWCKARFC